MIATVTNHFALVTADQRSIDSQTQIVGDHFYKIFKVNDNTLVGGVGVDNLIGSLSNLEYFQSEMGYEEYSNFIFNELEQV